MRSRRILTLNSRRIIDKRDIACLPFSCKQRARNRARKAKDKFHYLSHRTQLHIFATQKAIPIALFRVEPSGEFTHHRIPILPSSAYTAGATIVQQPTPFQVQGNFITSMQATNPPPTRQESNMDNGSNYNGLAAYHPHQGSQNTQGQPVYGYTPSQQAPSLPNPIQPSASVGNVLQQSPPSLSTVSMIEGNRKFTYVCRTPQSNGKISAHMNRSLSVVQQPKRARMCGFGDKVASYFNYRMEIYLLIMIYQDRRPITPPPCIRLVVTDVATGIEIDLKYVSLLGEFIASNERTVISTTPCTS